MFVCVAEFLVWCCPAGLLECFLKVLCRAFDVLDKNSQTESNHN